LDTWRFRDPASIEDLASVMTSELDPRL